MVWGWRGLEDPRRHFGLWFDASSKIRFFAEKTPDGLSEHFADLPAIGIQLIAFPKFSQDSILDFYHLRCILPRLRM